MPQSSNHHAVLPRTIDQQLDELLVNGRVPGAAPLFWLGNIMALAISVSTFRGLTSACQKKPYFYLGLMMPRKLWMVLNGFCSQIWPLDIGRCRRMKRTGPRQHFLLIWTISVASHADKLYEIDESGIQWTHLNTLPCVLR